MTNLIKYTWSSSYFKVNLLVKYIYKNIKAAQIFANNLIVTFLFSSIY